MKIKINEKIYNFIVTGTVGLVYLAERMLGEAFDADNRYHLATLYLACLKSCNRGTDMDGMDTDTLLAHMTGKMFSEMSTYFWDQWYLLEGNVSAKEDDQQGEG